MPLVRGSAGAATYEKYRRWLADAADWSLTDATLAEDIAPSGLQVIASMPGAGLDGTRLGLQCIFDEVPVGTVAAVSLQVLEDPPPMRQGALLIRAPKCSMCRYPDGLHAADCPRGGRVAEAGRTTS